MHAACKADVELTRHNFFPLLLRILARNPQTVSILIGRRSNVVQSEWGRNGAKGVTVCGWHVRAHVRTFLLRITVARILWDFDFLRGLAPGRLDGFSIGRYEKNRESFDLYAAKFESKAMRFWGKKSPRRWNAFKRFQNKASTLVSLL